MQTIEPVLVFALLLNFFILGNSRMWAVIYAVAVQGAALGAMYPIAHQQGLYGSGPEPWSTIAWLTVLTLAIIGIKGILIPRLLFRAMRDADIQWHIESAIGILPSLLIGAAGASLALVFARRLPLVGGHTSALVIPAALATMLTGFLVLITRKLVLSQVLGYILLENGIFIFGLLLIEAVPILVELGVVLDLVVCVFVMGIIINHVNRSLPAATAEHLSTLRE